MYLLIIGIVMLTMKYMEIPPVSDWSWWIVFIPFALAVAWWSWADWSGYTKRKVVERENSRKQARIDKQKEALGMPTSKGKRR